MTTNNCSVVEASEIIVIAVKPHLIQTVLEEISPVVTERHLFVSVAAGITIADMQTVSLIGRVKKLQYCLG